MSRMQIRTQSYGNFTMNVLSFAAPLYGSVSSLQTKTMQHHFPVRANQPNVQFSVIFSNHEEFERFQKLVRRTQQKALSATPNSDVGVTLWWPERQIDNWTGIINEFEAGGRKQDWAPRAKFTVDLMDSWVSRRTARSSTATPFSSIFRDTLLTQLFMSFEDAILRLPSLLNGPSQQQDSNPSGQSRHDPLGPIFGGGGTF